MVGSGSSVSDAFICKVHGEARVYGGFAQSASALYPQNARHLELEIQNPPPCNPLSSSLLYGNVLSASSSLSSAAAFLPSLTLPPKPLLLGGAASFIGLSVALTFFAIVALG